MNGNQYSESRNRRELKLEKEELTALFSELISVINEKVCQVDDDYAKTPKLMIQVKTKSKFPNIKKDDRVATATSLQKSTNLPKKTKHEQMNDRTKHKKLGSK